MSVTMLTGGHGSGKTALAIKLANKYDKKYYIATAEAFDEEMVEKIILHQRERINFTTIEEPLDMEHAFSRVDDGVVVLDCITTWVGNLFYYEKNIEEYCDKLINILKSKKNDVIIITNESNLTIIPGDTESRQYMRTLAIVNKRLAEAADNVALVVCGLSIYLKGGLNDK